LHSAGALFHRPLDIAEIAAEQRKNAVKLAPLETGDPKAAASKRRQKDSAGEDRAEIAKKDEK